MQIQPVNLFPKTADWLYDLCKLSIDLAQFSNRFSSVDYDILEPEWRDWDRENGTPNLRDPLRNSLKVQKYGIIGGNGLLFSASHAAANSLAGNDFHPYTPLSAGALARSAVEQLLHSYYLLNTDSFEEFTGRTYRLFDKGIRDYSWARGNSAGRNNAIEIYSEWAEGRSIPKKPKYDPPALLRKIIAFHTDPYGYLSDFVHGNPVATSLSVLDAQEDFGINRQNDYWSLAIAYVTSLATIIAFSEKYPHIGSDAQSHELNKFRRFSNAFELRAAEEWGPPKRIPDRDYE